MIHFQSKDSEAEIVIASYITTKQMSVRGRPDVLKKFPACTLLHGLSVRDRSVLSDGIPGSGVRVYRSTRFEGLAHVVLRKLARL
jgi:hypothetical protein